MRRWFYHIKNLQSTKTKHYYSPFTSSFITLRIYKVLKPVPGRVWRDRRFITLTIYKVLKLSCIDNDHYLVLSH